jgi:CPA2 family monovalent cation:H+ antiporter-2
VPEALESSLMLASHALLLCGVPLAHVQQQVRAVRESRYGLLRGFFHGADDPVEDLTERRHLRMHSVPLAAGAAAIGKTLASLELAVLNVELAGIRRKGATGLAPEPELVLQAGDVLVLKGTPEPIALAEERLLRG